MDRRCHNELHTGMGKQSIVTLKNLDNMGFDSNSAGMLGSNLISKCLDKNLTGVTTICSRT